MTLKPLAERCNILTHASFYLGLSRTTHVRMIYTRTRTRSLAMAAGMEGGGGSSAGLGRGEFLSSVAASAGLGLAAAAASPGAAGAAVNFETERYGDKELKIATVNKLRQQIRNSVRNARASSRQHPYI